MNPRRIAIAYVPVLHRGYVDFFHGLEQDGVTELYLVSDDVLASQEEFDYLNRKDRLRALTHEEVLGLVSSIVTITVDSLTLKTIRSIPREGTVLIMPNEDINIRLSEMYFGGYAVEYRSVFLRWHKENTGEHDEACGASLSSLPEFGQTVFNTVLAEATKTADWWRQVGAALVQEGKVVALAHNEHMPEEELPNILGDTRALFTKGVHIDYVTAAHAEVGVIGEAAQRGVSTQGAELYVTDFPCPYCARLIAKSGIKKIYFIRGYAVLGGEDFFRDVGIETVKVDIA